MATLLDALTQENLDNQREVVKNEKRQSYDNRPYGSFYEKLMAAVFPEDHPYHHTPIGSMADLDAASLEDVIALLPGLVRAQQRGADRSRATSTRRRRFAAAERWFGPIPAEPRAGSSRGPRRVRADHRRRDPGDGARRGAARARPFRLSDAGLRHRRVRRARGGDPDPRRRPRLAPVPAARARGAGRPGRGRVHAAARGRRVDPGGLGDGPARERRGDRAKRMLARGDSSGWSDEPVTDDELARARALIESAELGALSAASRRSPTGSRSTRRTSTGRSSSTSSWPLSRGRRRAHPAAAAARLPARQPRRHHLRARRRRARTTEAAA